MSFYFVQNYLRTEAAAGINKTINFQGKMTDDNGLNVADGNYQFVFSLYTVSSGGSATWTETVNLDVADGIFHHALGSDTALPGSVDFNTDNIFLGITFNSDPDGEMTPRIQLSASPYAFNADQLDGLDAEDFVQLSPSVAQTGSIDITGSISAGSATLSGDISINGGDITSSGALNIQPNAGSSLSITLSTTGDLVVNTDQFYIDTSAGNVGIGNASPSAKLEITGDIYLSNGADRTIKLENVASGAGNNLSILGSNGSGTSAAGGSLTLQGGGGGGGFSVGGSVNIYGGTGSFSGGNVVIRGGTASWVGGVTINDSHNGGTAINTGTSNGWVSIGNASAGVITLQTSSTIGLTGTTTITGQTTGTALVVNNSTSTGNILQLQDNGSDVLVVADGGQVTIAGNVGIGTTGPDRILDILDASNPQLRLTHTDGSAYTDMQTDASGSLNVSNTGGVINLQTDVQISNRIYMGATVSLGQCYNPVSTYSCDTGLQLENTSAGTTTQSFGTHAYLTINASGENSVNNAGQLASISLTGSQNYSGINYGTVSTVLVDNAFGLINRLVGAGGGVAAIVGTNVANTVGMEASNSFAFSSVTNNYGFFAHNPTISFSALTNNYGLYVANQTAGTNDYGVYVAGADTYALWVDSGASRLDGSLNVQGNTDLDGLLAVGSTSSVTGLHVIRVSHTMSVASCNVGCFGVQSAFTASGAATGSAYGLATTVTLDGASAGANTVGLWVGAAAETNGAAINNNYGIQVSNQTAGNNNYGIYIEGASTYALWIDAGVSRFDGDVVLNAALPSGDTADTVCRSSTGVLSTCTSAARFKDNVANLSYGLDELRQLQPVSYIWNTTGKADLGFVAEQVAAVIPQAVTYDESGEVASFNYNTISALLVAATKELDVRVDNSTARLAVVEHQVSNLELNSIGWATSSSVQSLAIGLQNRLAILEQGIFSQLTVSGSVNVGGDLTVAGTINAVSLRLSGKLITSGQTPTGSVLGSASGLVSLNGNDTAGEVEFVLSNSDTPTSGQQFRINFASAFGAKPRVNVTPASAFAGNIRYYVDSDQSGFTVHFTDAPLPGEPYKFNYLVVQ